MYMENYMSIPEAAVLWNTLADVLRRECEANKITGAVRFGYRWMIPTDADCPPRIVRHSSQRIVG